MLTLSHFFNSICEDKIRHSSTGTHLKLLPHSILMLTQNAAPKYVAFTIFLSIIKTVYCAVHLLANVLKNLLQARTEINVRCENFFTSEA